MNKMQTSEWVELHQWDAACRTLMQLHPWHGLSLAGMLVDGHNSGLRRGWNRVLRDSHAQNREVFIYIGEGDGESNITTVRPDVSPESIHEAQDKHPDLDSSDLWSIIRRLGPKLAQKHFLQSPDESVRVAQSVERSGRDLRDMDRMHSLWSISMAGMRQAIRDSRGGAIKHADFLKPIQDLVKAYLSFELPGKLASEVVGVLLSTQCTIPLLGPPGTMPAKARMAALEHLADTAYELLSERASRNVQAYFEMTYLASLYCGAAMRIADWAEASGKHCPQDLDRIKKLCLNIDELQAHKTGMTFILPALFAPRALLVWVADRARQTTQSVDQVADFYNLHPGLRALLEPEPRYLGLSDAEVAEAYKTYSDGCDDFDAGAALQGSAAPVARENLEKIMMDFLAIGFGQASL
jgi:hypothetical protein